MNIWVENVIVSGIILTELIKEKVKVFAKAFGIQENQLNFSND